MVLTLSAVYSHDHRVDWELKLTVTTQGHQGVSYHISLTQERIKIQNLKYGFYFVGTAFAPL